MQYSFVEIHFVTITYSRSTNLQLFTFLFLALSLRRTNISCHQPSLYAIFIRKWIPNVFHIMNHFSIYDRKRRH